MHLQESHPTMELSLSYDEVEQPRPSRLSNYGDSMKIVQATPMNTGMNCVYTCTYMYRYITNINIVNLILSFSDTSGASSINHTHHDYEVTSSANR